MLLVECLLTVLEHVLVYLMSGSVWNDIAMNYFIITMHGGLAQLVATLVGSTKLLYAGPG